MKKHIQTYIELPFEVDKTYQTKFQTGERFLIKKIIMSGNRVSSFQGIYEKAPHIGLCPLNGDRLIPDKIKGDEICVCSKCGEPFENITYEH